MQEVEPVSDLDKLEFWIRLARWRRQSLLMKGNGSCDSEIAARPVSFRRVNLVMTSDFASQKATSNRIRPKNYAFKDAIISPNSR